MRLLDRYLLRELLLPFGFCLGGFLIFWISSDLFSKLGDFQKDGLRFGDIAALYAVKAPEFLALVLPVAFLLAVLYSLTQHARYHEITAMRAAGISLWRLALPYFGVGFLASVALFAINELWAAGAEERAEFIAKSRGPTGANKFEPQLARNLPFVNNRDGRRWLIGVFNSRTAQMTNVQVEYKLPDNSRRMLFAASADWTNDQWVFHDVKEYLDLGGTNTSPVPGLLTNRLALPEFSETPEEIRSEIRISQRLTLKNRHRADLPIVEILNYKHLHPQAQASELAWLDTKFQSRIAGPWKCLVVVLIALPFGAASGRRNIFVGVASSILICFAYFVLLEVCLAAGAAGKMPPWLAGWLPNIVFSVIGIGLSARVR